MSRIRNVGFSPARALFSLYVNRCCSFIDNPCRQHRPVEGSSDRGKTGWLPDVRGSGNPFPDLTPGPAYWVPDHRPLQRVYGRPHQFPPENSFLFRPDSVIFAVCSGHIPGNGGKVVQPGMVRALLYQFSLRGLHPCEEHTLRRRYLPAGNRKHEFRSTDKELPAPCRFPYP